MSKEKYTPSNYGLWKFFIDNHNLILIESELDDIVYAVEDYIFPKEKWKRKLIKSFIKIIGGGK